MPRAEPREGRGAQPEERHAHRRPAHGAEHHRLVAVPEAAAHGPPVAQGVGIEGDHVAHELHRGAGQDPPVRHPPAEGRVGDVLGLADEQHAVAHPRHAPEQADPPAVEGVDEEALEGVPGRGLDPHEVGDQGERRGLEPGGPREAKGQLEGLVADHEVAGRAPAGLHDHVDVGPDSGHEPRQGGELAPAAQGRARAGEVEGEPPRRRLDRRRPGRVRLRLGEQRLARPQQRLARGVRGQPGDRHPRGAEAERPGDGQVARHVPQPDAAADEQDPRLPPFHGRDPVRGPRYAGARPGVKGARVPPRRRRASAAGQPA